MTLDPPRYQPLHVEFDADRVSVAYLDREDPGPGTHVHTLQIPVAVIADSVTELLDDVEQLIHTYLDLERHPPESLAGRLPRR